jgi:hypothetical protein
MKLNRTPAKAKRRSLSLAAYYTLMKCVCSIAQWQQSGPIAGMSASSHTAPKASHSSLSKVLPSRPETVVKMTHCSCQSAKKNAARKSKKHAIALGLEPATTADREPSAVVDTTPAPIASTLQPQEVHRNVLAE